MFSEQVLREYVKQDRQLIREFQPDLVVSDMRMSAAVSARLEAVPLRNAHECVLEPLRRGAIYSA